MSNLSIQERRIGDVTILDMDGNIRIGGSNVALKNAISSPGYRRSESDCPEPGASRLHRFERAG